MTDSYDQVTKYTDAMIEMLQHNVIGGALSQQLQDAWVAEWNGIRAQLQASI